MFAIWQPRVFGYPTIWVTDTSFDLKTQNYTIQIIQIIWIQVQNNNHKNRDLDPELDPILDSNSVDRNTKIKLTDQVNI